MNNPFETICERLTHIEGLLTALTETQVQAQAPVPDPDELFDVDGVAKFFGVTKATVYGLNAKGELPAMKRGKRCYYRRADLLAYLKAGRKKSNDEKVAEEVATYNSTKKGR